jgi:alkylation response protein AidB-like acyl-CoA dehydrogenase
MALTAAQLAEQKKQAEELLFSGPQTLGFCKALFFGHFNGRFVFPYPEVRAEERAEVERSLAEARKFADEVLDPVAIDRAAEIPQHVIDELGRLGVLGMCAPKELGGRGFSQLAYCKVLEIIGGKCAATGIFINAHHSIGLRALVLFGTDEQKRKWLPDLIGGKKLAAFALTEPEAGSDAANVQTTATPSADGKTYILNGQKRYITNGGIAQVLTVMARTPVPGSNETKVTAFLVTPDMPGFEVVEKAMPKCGIRGTMTARLAFHDMPVPAENILGQINKGLKVALTVLDFGRTTFGASCTGAAKICLDAASRHAKKRVQFKQTLSEFELVKKKIAWMAAYTYAMESMTSVVAGFIDSGCEDYMLETAILKLFATEALWIIVNDTIQIHGGQAYFTNEPYERMMRDARINQIGEGANDVLRAFIAAVGMRGVGLELLDVLKAVKNPFAGAGKLLKFGKDQLSARFTTPDVPVRSANLKAEAGRLGKLVRDFGLAVQWVLRHCGSEEVFLRSQYLQERIAEAASDLYASACVLSRLDSLAAQGNGNPVEVHREEQVGKYFLKLADRRIRQHLAALSDNDDPLTTKVADLVFAKY